jgi:hypothetical protein
LGYGGPKPRILGFERADAILKRVDGCGDILGEQHLWDMLWAIGVPGFDSEYDGCLRARLITFREQACDLSSGSFSITRAVPQIFTRCRCS